MSERDDIEQVEAVPRAVLTLCQQAYMRTIRQHTLRATAAYARLSFDYGGWRISAEGDLHEMRHADDGHDIQLRRSRSLENEAREALEHLRLTDARLISTRIRPLGPGFVAGDYVFERAHDELADADHWLVLLPRLSAAGFKLEFDAAFPYAVTGEPDAWRADVEHGDNQWFDLSLGIDVDGQRVDLLPILRKLIADPDFPLRPMRNEAEDAVWLVAIDARRRVPLRLSRLRGLLEPLLEWLDAPNDCGRLRLSKLEHGVLDKIERNGVLRKGERLVADREECVALVHDLLESTTVFFRDPEAYAGLARTLPHLLLAAPVPHIWVPACAAGEDVYSIAMLVAEAQLGSEIPADFFVLGTDIDLDLLLEAQRGGFGSISAALVPAHLREAYLEFDDGECRVSRSLMSFCSFALHDVLTSPAIQAFDLVDCRNLLGSLQLHAQRRAVEQFAAALRPGGLLLVGRNDVMNAHHDLFERSALANGLFVRRELLPSMSQADTLPYTSYREALEVSATLGAVLDEHGHLLEVNPTLLTFLGSQLDWSGRNAEALLAAGEWTRLLRALGQSARAEMDLHLLIGDHAAPARVSLSRWQTAQGPRLIVEWRLEPEPGDPRPPGDFLHLVRTGLRIMGEGVIATDALGSIDLINPAAERLTGWSQAEALGLGHDSVLKFVSQGQAVAASPVWRCLRREGETLIREERQLLGRDGRRLRVRLTCARLVEDGVVLGALLLLQDITEQSLLVAELAYRSAHDSLTGLYNRGEFERRLSAALALAKSGEATHWLALIDIDQFKVINDTLGHYAGDELLRRLAPVLRSQLRSDDAVARLGGDEFGVLIRAGDATEARRIIDLLLDAVRGYRFAWDERSYSVTVSVGVAEVSAQSEDMARVFANADAACFAAKDAGRDRSRWVLHGDADIRQRHAEMSMVGRIGKALDEQQFLLFYEDVIPASGSTQVHYRELLVRMLDDDGTLVQPAAFIAAAERYYLMTALDRWVVDHACAGIARLPADGVIYAINVSGMSLSDDQFLAFVIGCIERYGVAPERICFEITETAAISHLSEAMSFINRLADLGCRFALDDFGVGMASFSYLKTLPVHFVKIDGSFVRAMHSSAVDRSMVEAINRLGHDMGLRTIAEHVEDAQTLCALGALGVDWVQGKAIAPGRPFNELLG